MQAHVDHGDLMTLPRSISPAIRTPSPALQPLVLARGPRRADVIGLVEGWMAHVLPLRMHGRCGIERNLSVVGDARVSCVCDKQRTGRLRWPAIKNEQTHVDDHGQERGEKTPL